MSTGDPQLKSPSQVKPSPLVVVADDTAALRLLLRRVLEMSGYRVEAYPDGQQAYEACQALKPELIVTDIHMPKLQGTELLRRIRAAGDATPVLVVSSYFDEASLAACLEHPGVATLTKPFTIGELTQAVESLLRNPAEC